MPSFQDLPLPILYHILTYLPDLTTVVHLECTCRDFRRASLEFSLWEDRHRRRWQFQTQGEVVDYKKDYARRHLIDRDILKRIHVLLATTTPSEGVFVPLVQRGREAMDVVWQFHDENNANDADTGAITLRLIKTLQQAALFQKLVDVHYQEELEDTERLEEYAIWAGLLCDDQAFRNFEIRAQGIRSSLDGLAAQVTHYESVRDRVLEVNRVLFQQAGFTGNRVDYRNSLLHTTMERGTGIPMTLAILYKLVARRVGIQADIVGLPGHIVIGIPDLQDTYLDVFDEGNILHTRDLVNIVGRYGIPFQANFTRALTPRETFRRVCNNLRNQEEGSHQPFATMISFLLVNRDGDVLVNHCHHVLWRRWNEAQQRGV